MRSFDLGVGRDVAFLGCGCLMHIIGTIVAAILSWNVHHNLILALVHALLGWAYVAIWLFN